MALFTGVQHWCTFNIIAPLFIIFYQMFGRHRTPSACPSLLMFRIDRPISRISSSLVLYRAPRSGSFTLAKISYSHRLGRKRRHLVVQNPSFLMTMQRITPLLLSRTSCAAGNGTFWNIHRTHPIWVHAITISLSKWKNHWEGPGTIQDMDLSVL